MSRTRLVPSPSVQRWARDVNSQDRDRDETETRRSPIRDLCVAPSRSSVVVVKGDQRWHYFINTNQHQNNSNSPVYSSNQNRLSSVSINGLVTWKVEIETETSALETETRPTHLDVAPWRDRDETMDRSQNRDVSVSGPTLPWRVLQSIPNIPWNMYIQ